MPNTGSRSKTERQRKVKIKKLIFIDRDGVINCDVINGYITRWKDFKFIPRALKALRKLTQHQYKIIIVSNQAGIGDGVYSKKSLNEITKKMLSAMEKSKIKISGVYYCLHGKNAGCSCRKPKTGLFRRASRYIEYDRSQTYLIGDKVSDLLAGKQFGLKTIFVLTGHGKSHLKKITDKSKPDLIARDLCEAVEKLLQ